MSQHNDILKFEIAAGISDGLSVSRIVERVQGILLTMEWDGNAIDSIPSDLMSVIVSMRRHKDGVYGPSHEQLDKYLNTMEQEFKINPFGF